MKLGNVNRRLALVGPHGAADVEALSGGEFTSEPQAIFERWLEFTGWVENHATKIAGADYQPIGESDLGAPVPSPRQVFAIGLNYRDHAAEAGLALPEGNPVVFTKFPSSIIGPGDTVELPSDAVDYEAELVVVIGMRAHRVSAEDGWQYVAGLTMGQDLSERDVQFRGPTPQFSLGKSFPGFSPIGPVLVSLDEFNDPDNIGIGCTLNGQQMQKGRTNDMVFPVPEIVASLSEIVPLLPGDLIFTGTPAGIGWARDPKVTLRDGDRIVTQAEVIGEMTTVMHRRINLN